ncbi:hypothetical protein K443DRAFT_467836 [Laccaria amethystina LaAM-08-1]|uniref:Uncharacterized protein n=1 Tax=Laccaria amethystina LaAM-08-1 TaxID=1095629 RepID=A0A0C9WTX0_9AGAR|nr:hypothetical protein K443DRAFT_467836 [Laccaria amethystina LaAM-08-1]
MGVTPLVRLRGVKSQRVSPPSALEYHQSSIAPLTFIFLNPSDVRIHPNILPSLPTVVDPTLSSPLPLAAPKIAHETTKMFSCSILRMGCSPFGHSQSNTIQRNQVCLLPSSRRPFLPPRAFRSLGWVPRGG